MLNVRVLGLFLTVTFAFGVAGLLPSCAEGAGDPPAPATGDAPDAGKSKGSEAGTAPAGSGPAVEQLVADARFAVARDRYDQARQLFKQAMSATPDDVALILEYCSLCSKARDWSDGATYLEKVFALDPSKEKEYYVDYGQHLFKLRKYDKAVQVLKKSLEYGKDKDQAHKTLIQIAKIQKDAPLIESEYEEYLKLKPQDGDMQVEYADWLYGRKRTKEAIARYKLASPLKPRDAYLHERIGYMLVFEKDFDGAIDEYKKALAAGSKNGGKIVEAIKYASRQKKAAGAK